MGEAIAHYVRTGCLARCPNPLSPEFTLRTEETPLPEISESKVFGSEDEALPEELSDHGYTPKRVCQGGYFDLDDSDLSDGSDLDLWEDYDDYYGLDSRSEFISEEEIPVKRTIPDGLDWTAMLARRRPDCAIHVDRKEDYHYMMP
jgi:hypothetical protein